MESWRWDMKSDPDYEVIGTLSHGYPNQMTVMRFSPDGLFLACEEPLGRITIWNTELRESKATLADSTFGVLQFISPIFYLKALASSADGKYLASACVSGDIKIWDAKSYQELQAITHHPGEVTALTFSPDGIQMISGSDNHLVLRWDIPTGSQELPLVGRAGPPYCVAFSPDGTMIASETTFGVNLWDAATGTRQKELNRLGAPTSFRTVAFPADGKKIAAASKYEQREFLRRHPLKPIKAPILAFVQCWDVKTGVRQRRTEGSLHSFTALVFSRDGKQLASGSSNGIIELWDVASGSPIKEFNGNLGAVTAIAFSSDGKMIASAGADLTLRLWEVDSVWDSIPLVRNTFVRLLQIIGQRVFELPECVRTLNFYRIIGSLGRIQAALNWKHLLEFSRKSIRVCQRIYS